MNVPEDVIQKTKELHAGLAWVGFGDGTHSWFYRITWNNPQRYFGSDLTYDITRKYIERIAKDILGWKRWQIIPSAYPGCAIRKIE